MSQPFNTCGITNLKDGNQTAVYRSFAGLDGFHLALSRGCHRCVIASEIDPELRTAYSFNFPYTTVRDESVLRSIPNHDILCAGFPCQPFSKAGLQLGQKDKASGNLFEYFAKVIEEHRPKYVTLEKDFHQTTFYPPQNRKHLGPLETLYMLVLLRRSQKGHLPRTWE